MALRIWGSWRAKWVGMRQTPAESMAWSYGSILALPGRKNSHDTKCNQYPRVSVNDRRCLCRSWVMTDITVRKACFLLATGAYPVVVFMGWDFPGFWLFRKSWAFTSSLIFSGYYPVSDTGESLRLVFPGGRINSLPVPSGTYFQVMISQALLINPCRGWYWVLYDIFWQSFIQNPR